MTVALVTNIARPISSALSQAFAMDTVGKIQAYGKLGAWSPLSLFAAGEQGAWYDPSDLTTLFQDAAGTMPVTADGQPVGKILDKSGRGNHASQATAASRPLYKTDGTYHWLQFDGVDDSLSTAAIDFTSTDKMSVFSGVKKNNDAVSIVAELSSNIITNGSFYLVAGTDAGGTGYSSMGKGTAAADPALAAKAFTFNAPDTAVLTATHDIAGDLSTLRRNGTVGTNGTADKGTGNFGNYPLYLGQRGGLTLPFNGNIYSLIVRGALSTAQEITDTETWVNSKTGAY